MLQSLQGFLRLGLLHHAQHGIDHHHKENDDHVGNVRFALGSAGHRADDGSGQKQDDHRVGQLGEQALPKRVFLGFVQFVGAVGLQALGRLGRGEARLRVAL